MKYIVLLRGINISGKNKISMAELKRELDKNYQNIMQYIILFSVYVLYYLIQFYIIVMKGEII